MTTKITQLPTPEFPYFHNLQWDNIYDGFMDEYFFYNRGEVDFQGNLLPEKRTRLFRDILRFAEDNTW